MTFAGHEDQLRSIAAIDVSAANPDRRRAPPRHSREDYAGTDAQGSRMEPAAAAYCSLS